MAATRKKFEVFNRLPLPSGPLGDHPPLRHPNVPRVGVDCDTAEQVVAEVAKTVFTDPSIAVLRTSDGRVFHRDVLAAIVQRKLPPEWLER